MTLRGLCCIALLLASPALAQQSASPVSPGQAAAAPAQKTAPITDIQVDCVPASRASELIDKHGCVAGKVSRITTQKNGNTRIVFCPRQNECEFQAVVFARDRENVGDLTYLHGRIVAILGEVTEYRGDAEIVIKDRKQIQVAAGDPPPEFDAARAKPAIVGQVRSGRRGRAW